MLSKREAFILLLDKLFEDEPVIKEKSSDNRVQEFKELLDDVIEDTPIENAKKLEIKHPKKKNGIGTRKKIQNTPDEPYEFAESYKKTINWKLFDDGTVGNPKYQTGSWESYQVLNVFRAVNFPILYKDFENIKTLLTTNGFSHMMGLQFLYNLQNQYKAGHGTLLSIIYNIYKNEYDVPPYSLFGVQNNQITINNVETGVKPFQLKQWFEEILSTPVEEEQEGIIVKIMHDNKNIIKKYLFTLLVNYREKSLLELL